MRKCGRFGILERFNKINTSFNDVFSTLTCRTPSGDCEFFKIFAESVKPAGKTTKSEAARGSYSKIKL